MTLINLVTGRGLGLRVHILGSIYKAYSNMARTPKLYFDHSFILYYIVYDYKVMIIVVHFIINLIESSLYYNS